MKRYKKGKQRGPVRAKKATADGIDFRSGLEKNTYLALKKAGLFEMYEEEVFQTLEGFTFPNISIEKQANGKGDLKDRGQKKVLGIKYTPDFTGFDYIIECKGRANEQFPLRWKLFKRWCVINDETRALYKPQNQKDVAIMIKMILDARK
tara:strand:+ start:255 stop:704 length:450 start_codon:yes stop_codon:yes gene_type:complete